jgi:hypothetical protein
LNAETGILILSKQGQKAQMKRERNAKDAKKGGNSQLKGVSLVYGYMVKDDIYSTILSN